MGLIGKQFEVIENDDELSEQFPMFIPGFKFQVISVVNEDDLEMCGITAVIDLLTNKIITINDPTPHGESWFWCFYSEDTMHQIKEIGQGEDVPLISEIKLNHFQGAIVPITRALCAFAGQENCDSEEYDLMQKAADYIVALEQRLGVRHV